MEEGDVLHQPASKPQSLEEEIRLLKLAKDAIDLQLLPEIEENARKCGQEVDHLLGVLQQSLAASTHVSLVHVQSMHGAVDDLSSCITNAVLCMNQLLSKVEHLNEEMRPVGELASQIKDISSSLTLLENAVAKMKKNK